MPIVVQGAPEPPTVTVELTDAERVALMRAAGIIRRLLKAG